MRHILFAVVLGFVAAWLCGHFMIGAATNCLAVSSMIGVAVTFTQVSFAGGALVGLYLASGKAGKR